MFDQLSARFGRLISTPRGFHGFIGLTLAVTFIARTALFPGASPDDAEQLLFSQGLAWGYEPGNPPLFTWLVIAGQKVFGVSIAATEAVKFAILFLTYALLVATGRRILGDDLAAAVSAMSFLGVYFFAWEFVLNFSHTVILVTFCVALLYSLLRIEERQDWLVYAILGAVLGFGLLSKYSFALFALGLAAAALTDPALRRRLLHPRMLMTLAIAAVIVTPHILWMLSGTEGIEGIVRERLSAAEADSGYGADVIKGLASLAIALAEFLSPWLVLALPFFWRAFGPLPGAGEAVRYRRLLGLQLALVALVFLVSIAGFGATRYRTSYMFVLVLAPLYFFTRVRALPNMDKHLARFALVLAVVGFLVPVALVVKFVIEPGYCKRCYFHIPYGEISAQLRKGGFERGTILTHSRPNQIGGALRPYFPDSRIISTKYKRYKPPYHPAAAPSAGSCLLLWDATRRSRARRAKRRLIDHAKKHLGADIDPETVPRTFYQPLAMSETRRFRFAYILIPGGTGDCR